MIFVERVIEETNGNLRVVLTAEGKSFTFRFCPDGGMVISARDKEWVPSGLFNEMCRKAAAIYKSRRKSAIVPREILV